MVRRRRSVWAALLLILVGVGGWILATPRGSSLKPGAGASAAAGSAAGQTAAGQTTQATRNRVHSDSAPGRAGTVASPAPAQPLPPEGEPLANHYDALVERARRGDIAAARRLYVDVSRCRAQRARSSFRNDVDEVPKRPTGRTDTDFQSELASWRRRALERCAGAAQCSGIEPAQLQQPEQWLLRAAELGDIASRVSFASGESFAITPSLDSYPLLARWRQQAVPWLEQAVATGEPAALLALGGALVHSRDRAELPMLAQITADDPERGYALLYALSRAASIGSSPHVQGLLGEAGERLDITRRLRARQVGGDLYRRHRRVLDAATETELRTLGESMRPFNRRDDDAQLAARAPACAAQIEAQVQQALPAPVVTPQTAP